MDETDVVPSSRRLQSSGEPKKNTRKQVLRRKTRAMWLEKAAGKARIGNLCAKTCRMGQSQLCKELSTPTPAGSPFPPPLRAWEVPVHPCPSLEPSVRPPDGSILVACSTQYSNAASWA